MRREDGFDRIGFLCLCTSTVAGWLAGWLANWFVGLEQVNRSHQPNAPSCVSRTFLDLSSGSHRLTPRLNVASQHATTSC